MFNRTTSKDGEFPGWVQVQKISDSTTDYYQQPSLPDKGTDIAISWAAKILPEIERQGLWDQITTNSGGAGFNYSAIPKIEEFICPE